MQSRSMAVLLRGLHQGAADARASGLGLDRDRIEARERRAGAEGEERISAEVVAAIGDVNAALGLEMKWRSERRDRRSESKTRFSSASS